MQNIEGKEYLKYEWIDLEKINKYNLLPICLKDILKINKYPVHIINDDLNKKYDKIYKNKSYDYIGKIVSIVIDRKLGTKHPNSNIIYPINYGYVPNTKSGDNEEIDAYIIGVFEPLEKFTGKCIAVIHRLNEEDDKLVIVPKDKNYTKEQIETLVEFQERFFDSEIIM